jgi:ankyrin repeat protein
MPLRPLLVAVLALVAGCNLGAPSSSSSEMHLEGVPEAEPEMTPEQARGTLLDRGYPLAPGSMTVAAGNGDAEAVALYLAAGADPNSGSGYSGPLVRAVESGSAETVAVLLSAGADPYVDDGEVAVRAVRAGDPAVLAAVVGEQGWAAGRALVEAAKCGSPEMVSLLLAAGADPANSTNADGLTPLGAVAMGGCGASRVDAPRYEVVQLLVAAGADPNGPMASGDRPLHVAAFNDVPAVVLPLIAAGADPNLPVRGGRATPLDRARSGMRSTGTSARLIRDNGGVESDRSGARYGY